MAQHTIPEQGQLVEVRRRRFIVTDVVRSAAPALQTPDQAEPQHLVSLSSIEDDARGEELQVIWELEPGARLNQQAHLPVPAGFDAPRRLDAFLNAIRWGAVSSADVRELQAPFRSGIDIQSYQLDPVARAIQMPRVNLLIADDVGLGKTIEAGLVIQELLIRHRARRILIVCPSALQIQWREQLREKFGLEFRIVDGALMRELRRTRGIHANPWAHFPRLITSIDFLKRDRSLRLLREQLPAEGQLVYPRRFDLLIVDEAHHVAPSGRGQYAIDSQRTAAIRLLTPHVEHKLFLSATPHNGYPESFSALLELLDDQRFARSVRPDPAQLAAVMVRRLKSELRDKLGKARFPERRLEVIEVPYTDAERQAHRWFQDYAQQAQQRASDGPARAAIEFVLKLLKKRLFSSPEAFRLTLDQHRQTLASGPRPRAARPAPGVLRALIDEVDSAELEDAELEQRTDEALWTMGRLFADSSAAEGALLDQLGTWAARAAQRADTKAQALIDWIERTLRPAGDWNDERVIIFTEYRATQQWLFRQLASAGLTLSGRMMMLHGGMRDEDREQIKHAFLAHPAESPVRILLATDAASEGIDLQRHCHRLIHYEIPWNPNRLEQRNGRIDRHGQRHQPLIYHFVPAGYQQRADAADVAVGELEGDLEFLLRAVRKVEQIREDLGKVGPVIAEQVTQAMLSRARRARLDTDSAERARERSDLRRLDRMKHDLAERVKALENQIYESRAALNITPDNVAEVVQIALQLAGQPALERVERDGQPVYRLPPLSGSWARAAEGLAHPHTGAIRPLTFDHDFARNRDDVVLAHLNHPLVQMALRLLRAEVWGSGVRLNRVAARVVPDAQLSEPVAVALGRLVISGPDGARLHEELIPAGGTISDGRFSRMGVKKLDELLAAPGTSDVPDELKAHLAELWPRIAQPLQNALERRAADRAASLAGQLADRQKHEAEAIAAVLRELERAIRAELHQPAALQLSLFSADERGQYQRDVAALEQRLAQIPAEIEQETARIAARYAAPQERLFPVAVMFLIPARMTH